MSTMLSRYAFLSAGWSNDGYPHTRTEDGFCESCGATKAEPHYRLIPKEEEK